MCKTDSTLGPAEMKTSSGATADKPTPVLAEVSLYDDSAVTDGSDVVFSRRHAFSSAVSACESGARKLRAITLLLTVERAEALRILNDEAAEEVLIMVAELASQVHVLAMLAEQAAIAERDKNDIGAPLGEVANG
ncbi:hypothetical protein [Burkholderia gladioli]|uniref:hypothetical protein n=1 Tax=Burkholderia gladioli TaxID=28095 RepID=UPI00163F291B|nr:hypothetical protein [Burkholderia gladioli]